RRRHTRFSRDWSSDVCSSDLLDWNDLAQEPGAELAAYTARLTALRRARSSLRTSRYGDASQEAAPGLPQLSWFTEGGQPMDAPRSEARREGDVHDMQWLRKVE